MNRKTLRRVHYFTGEFLGAADYRAEQDYQRALIQKHNQLYTPGIARGLQVNLSQGFLEISAGMAIDGQGREIVLTGYWNIKMPPSPKSCYFLTIAYAEVMADLEQDKFKRSLQRPLFRLRDPFQILLDDEVRIVTLQLKRPQPQMTYHYCGIKTGALQFRNGESAAAPPTIAIPKSAETSTGAQTWLALNHGPLEIDAAGVQFEGDITIAQQLTIGAGSHSATLSVYGRRLQGAGTISSLDLKVTLNNGNFDRVVPQDRILVRDSITGDHQIRRVTSVLDPQNLQTDLAFSPALTGQAYDIEKAQIAAFHNTAGQKVLAADIEGNLSLGWNAQAATGAFQVTAEGKLGIGIADPETAVQVSGTVMAKAFVGDGSKLTGIRPIWQKKSSNIYYDNGLVGIGNDNPGAWLDVVGGRQFPGMGNISSLVREVKNNTASFTNVAVGDLLLVGDLPDDVPLRNRQLVAVDAISSSNQLVTTPSFGPLTDAIYQVVKPVAQFYMHATPHSGSGGEAGGEDEMSVPDPSTGPKLDVPAAANRPLPILTVLPNRQVGINQPAPAYTLDVNGTIRCDRLIVGTGVGSGLITANELKVLDSLRLGRFSFDEKGHITSVNLMVERQLQANSLQCKTLTTAQLSVGKSSILNGNNGPPTLAVGSLLIEGTLSAETFATTGNPSVNLMSPEAQPGQTDGFQVHTVPASTARNRPADHIYSSVYIVPVAKGATAPAGNYWMGLGTAT